MPTSKKFFSINSSSKLSDDLFLFIFPFISKLLSGCPTYPGCLLLSKFLSIYLIFTHLLSLFSENSLVGSPWLDARGLCTHPHPLCTPMLPTITSLQWIDRTLQNFFFLVNPFRLLLYSTTTH